MQTYLEALALDLGISMSAVHGWRRAGRVADRHRLTLVEAAQSRDGQMVTTADLDGFAKLRAGRPKTVQVTAPPAAVVGAEPAEQVLRPKMRQGSESSSDDYVRKLTNRTLAK
jgi:hypothetical protein